jgi:GNAT superfamily N-acetyltransferase
MAEHEHAHAVSADPACASAAAGLEHDPFYRTICGATVHDTARRRALLMGYFAYSIEEGRAIGRCLHLTDPTHGVAVWLLPQPLDVLARAAHAKRTFLEETLDTQGCANYYRFVTFMHAQAAAVVDDSAWYLSIVAVDPTAQGQGLGRTLLEPTLAEADRTLAICYLETFSPRAVPFYERLGFAIRARFTEPATGADYAVMVRSPVSPAEHGTP